MPTLTEIVDELSSVMERPVAEKLAQVMQSFYERLHEDEVLRRLEALENAVRQLITESQRSREDLDARFVELAEAQRRTEQRVAELAEFQRRAYEEFQEYRKQTDARFAELAEAQRRTEQRVEELAELQRRAYEEFQEYRKQTDARFAELAEAQRRTEQRLEELAEAQRRTEERLEKLAEEFAEYRKYTDARFAKLAEAQRRTQEALLSLTETVRDLQKQLGGLSQTVGYVLENEALKRLPELLLNDFGVRVQGKLRRLYVKDKTGRSIEVNIFGTGERDGETVTIVGESKSQLSKNDIDCFLRRTIGGLEGVYTNIFPVLITHMTSEPDAEEYARSLGVAVYFSYDL
ncbi:MAG: hypothetical protein HPY54_09985 [Chthonomonadetes bacterium]|nr:hypothetical protein [Chthonomonadetes bacterium]